ncbi:MAG TPA: hypothetical protein ENN73_05330, partial [Firmicutes bacterium]|nr:hypothetical protein [Bacillota bacterium]
MRTGLTKKFLVILGVIIFSTYLFSCGCGKLTEKAIEKGMEKALEEAQKEMEKQNIQSVPAETTEETVSEETSSSKGYGKMNDDKFVEIAAF